MESVEQKYKEVSAIRVTAYLLVMVSVVYPVLFAYINDELTYEVISRELLMTPIRLGGITLITYGVIQFTNRLVRYYSKDWVRYVLELPIICFMVYWWLVFVFLYIYAPFILPNVLSVGSWEFRQYIGIFMVATVFIYIFQSGLNVYTKALKKAAQAEHLQKEFAQVRLQALKSQVNPHFLFNSLSVLSSLVHVSAEMSEQFVIRLSKAYRYILEQKELDLVTLKSELDFLEAYFYLLQIRFEQKIQLQLQIDPSIQEYKLPPLTLQLLVENVVKHNKMSSNQPLQITISAQNESLVVRNSLRLREQQQHSTGIGLENIKKRYALLTEKKVAIERTEHTFSVTIPLLK
jgi:sensor histidine kinase YesM